MQKEIELKKELIEQFENPGEGEITATGIDGPGGVRMNDILGELSETVAIIKEPNYLKRIHKWASENTRDGRRIKKLLGDMNYWNQMMLKKKAEMLAKRNIVQQSVPLEDPDADELGHGSGVVGEGSESQAVVGISLLCCAVALYMQLSGRFKRARRYDDEDWG